MLWGNANAIPGDVKTSIREEAAKAFPNECCGLILKRGNKAVVWPCRNIASKPQEFFQAHPDDIADAEDAAGDDILMGYHSHTVSGPEPSMADKTDAERNQRASLIVSWPADDWALYHPNGWQAPLLGRPFVHGTLDCYTLIQDYFARHATRPLMLPYFERADEWWSDKKNALGEIVERASDLYMDNFEACGFVQVEEVQPDDVLLIQTPHAQTTNHAAIYLGEGMILHHMQGHISCIQPYQRQGSYYHRATRAILRYKA